MSNQFPDRITIEESSEIEVAPQCAELEIVIEGESSVFGNEAFKKSKEVAKFMDDLASIDFPPENVALQNISVETKTGRILSSSNAKFTILLKKINLEAIPALLGIVANQKNIEILDMNYDYGRLSKERTALLKEACVAAKTQGQEICSAFGVELLGVYSMMPKWTTPSTDAISQNFGDRGYKMSKTRGITQPEMEGLDFVANQKSWLILSLKVEFRVDSFKRS